MIDLRFVPLTQWPGEPTKTRRNAAFRSTYIKTLDLLESELKKIHAREIVIQAFYTVDQIRNDGWPKANQRPSHPGVILGFKKPEGERFQRDGKWYVNLTPLSFPCDTYPHLEHNIHAIALSLEALRAVDRYGVTKRSEQYAGWKQLPAPAAGNFGFDTIEDAAAFLVTQSGLPHPPTGPQAIIGNVTLRNSLYRAAAGRLHPDLKTGNHDLFVKLNQAKAMIDEAQL